MVYKSTSKGCIGRTWKAYLLLVPCKLILQKAIILVKYDATTITHLPDKEEEDYTKIKNLVDEIFKWFDRSMCIPSSDVCDWAVE